jgi:putative transcriptional regulator
MPNTTSLAEQLLIAMPGMEDGYFARSVSLICQHDTQGAMGLVLNQDSEFTLGSLFDQLGMPCQNPRLRGVNVLSGGPVSPERGFILHSDGRSWDSSLHLSNGLTVSTSRDILTALAAGEGPDRFLVMLGYSGWSAGQLEDELSENAWLNAPASENIIFDAPITERWQAAAQQIGVNLSLMSSHAGRA